MRRFRMIAAILSLVLLFGLFAGCGASGAPDAKPASLLLSSSISKTLSQNGHFISFPPLP